MAGDDNGKPKGLAKVLNDPRSKKEIMANIVSGHPIELADQINTLDKPLIIECACPGWQPREWPQPDAYPEELPPNYEEDGIRYPAVPCSLDDQADEIVQAVEAGCAGAHIHPRDPEDCLGTNEPDLVKEVYDRIRDQTDVVPLQHSWRDTPDGGMDFIDHAEELLERADGANTYLEGGLFLWPPRDRYPNNYEEAVREGLEYYHEHGIKPIHKVRGSYHARKLYRTVVEGDMPVSEPMFIVVEMGHPFGWAMDQDPWPSIDLVSTLEQTRRRFAEFDPVIGVYTGNRNWMPVTMMAILAGADIVRIGIEDYYWMYPHKNEVIQRNIDCIRKITDFCELIDRELAAPEQAREILGMNRL